MSYGGDHTLERGGERRGGERGEGRQNGSNYTHQRHDQRVIVFDMLSTDTLTDTIRLLE